MLIQTENGGTWLVQFHFRKAIVSKIVVNNKTIIEIVLGGNKYTYHKGYRGYFCEEVKDLLYYDKVLDLYKAAQNGVAQPSTFTI